MAVARLPLPAELVRGIALAVIFALAGAMIGYVLIPSPPPAVDPNAPAPDFTLLGQRVPTTADALDRALELVRRHAASSITLHLPDGTDRIIQRSDLGVQVHRSRLSRLMSDMQDPASPLRRYLARRPRRSAVDLPVPISVDVDRGIATLLALKDKVDRPALDARLDLESRKLVSEQEGLELDVHATFARLCEALGRGLSAVDAVAQKTEPRLRAAQLGNVAFDQVLGYFETNYARGEKHQLRTYNLRLAASRLDGYVVLPGETFDFNEIVGPRDEAHGYKVAPVIAEGELVDGIGGGTCQISGTLHAAAFFAGLQIVSRSPHTRPSSYLKMGLDAAVSFPTITLQLRNNFSFPVVLHETVRNGLVRAEILGPHRDLTVTYVRRILEVLPYEEAERPDPKLPSGLRVLAQRGVPGFKVLKYRILRDGPFATRQRFHDTYPPTTQIVRVGTGDMPRDGVDATHDPHPEYVADEYLVISQGPGLRAADADDTPGGPMVEQRTPGRTGVRGWTREAGFPYFEEAGDDDRGQDDCDGPECPSRKEKKVEKKVARKNKTKR